MCPPMVLAQVELVKVVLVMMIIIANKNIDQLLCRRYILAVLLLFTHLILITPWGKYHYSYFMQGEKAKRA